MGGELLGTRGPAVTYCVGMLLRTGLVMVSDRRTNAGMDQISIFRKMTLWDEPGERVIALMSAGNLAVTQSVVALLNEGVDDGAGGVTTMRSVPTMTGAARLVGSALREVERIDGPSLKAHGEDSSASFLLGGQVAGRTLRLFRIYAAGNYIEATPETPYFQIGETKYGKPILDRVLGFDTTLPTAAKCGLISMDSTMRSNLSVGPPVDLLLYIRDGLTVTLQRTIDAGDPYFTDIRRRWSEGLRGLFTELPDPDWTAVLGATE